MKNSVWIQSIFVIMWALIKEVAVLGIDTEYNMLVVEVNEVFPTETGSVTDKQYIRTVHSITDAHTSAVGEVLMIETDARIDTKYRTWKRNADYINSMLALPRYIYDAGR